MWPVTGHRMSPSKPHKGPLGLSDLTEGPLGLTNLTERPLGLTNLTEGPLGLTNLTENATLKGQEACINTDCGVTYIPVPSLLRQVKTFDTGL